MLYPELKKLKTKTTGTNVFGGYVHSLSAREGCFYDMENLSSDSFPLFKTRAPRAKWMSVVCDENGNVREREDVKYFAGKGITAAVNASGSLCICSGTKVYVGENIIEEARLSPNIKNRCMVPFGKNIFIAPDGKYLVKNESGGYDIKHVCNKFFAPSSLSVSFCGAAGENVSADNIGSLPENPRNGETALTANGKQMELLVYSASENIWNKIKNVYIKFSFDEIEKGFVPGDEAHISGNSNSALEENIPDETHKIVAVGNDYIATDGVLISAFTDEGISIEKRMPRLDFAVEHNNRIWGCRYGINENGDEVNEIYACALGDPEKWYKFDGVSTDSFAASLGCGGEFTGAGVLGNGPVFFKEDYIIRVSGLYPSDFTIDTLPARGIQKGCAKSCVNLNEKLFYKSQVGVMVYDGAFPYMISEALGNIKYSAAAAGGIDGKYYIAMTSEDNKRNIFVYNANTGLWYKEDDKDNTVFFVSMDGCLYFVREKEVRGTGVLQQRLYTFGIHDFSLAPKARNIFGGDDENEYMYEEEKNIEWFAETAMLGFKNSSSNEILRKLIITLNLGEDAYFSVSIKVEGENAWKKLCRINTPRKGAFSVPVNTPRSHSFALKFAGKGQCVLSGVTFCHEITGEVRGIG